MATRNPNVSHSHWRAPSGEEYPIVDAEPGVIFIIQPTDEDIKCATAKDPNNCALAQAWMRMHDVPDAQIGLDKCYLPIRLKGKLVALRLKTNRETRRVIETFDRTKKFPSEGLKLYGIPRSERMDSQRSQDKRSRERWNTMKNKPQKKMRRRDVSIRNASRRAHTVRDD